MQVLMQEELENISGGFHIGNLGGAVFGLALGFCGGGPVGLGMAVGALIGAEGINRLVELYQHSQPHRHTFHM